jgi:antitoxin HigA-1
VIVSFRNKRKRDFAEGKRVKALTESPAVPALSWIAWMLQRRLETLRHYPAIVWKLSSAIERGNTMARLAIHPGERVLEELETLHMSAAELARKLRVPTNRITQIINGSRSITADTALRLAHFFGTSPEFWLNLQTLHDLRLAQDSAGKSIKSLPRLKRPELVHADS